MLYYLLNFASFLATNDIGDIGDDNNGVSAFGYNPLCCFVSENAHNFR